MIIVITLGFDEKFALRAITRRGLKPEDEIIIVTSKPSDERTEKAFQNFTTILKKVFLNPKISRIDVEVKKFDNAVSTLTKEFLKRKTSKFILNLSGGLRALIMEVLVSATLLNISGEVEVELENFSGMISFPLEILHIPELDNTDRMLLTSINVNEEFSLSKLSKKLNISKTTTWRRIKKLQRLNIINKDKNYLTELGSIIKLIYCTNTY
ncbi:MAG: CRISPR-associated CARF protein Csa3 [Candidatus Bathyarchaeia archaeon]|nr:CRISPR locus-related DNA-binding protein [Candidatus Bathyarchaeota archaeon]